jgi:hypothetical protein
MKNSNRRRLRGSVAALLLGVAIPALAQQALAQQASPPTEETNRYQLRLMMQIFDGAREFSHTQMAGFARMRRGDESWVEVDFGNGAVMIDSPGGAEVGSFRNTSKAEIGLRYNYATNTLSGDPKVADFHNRFVRPLLGQGPALGTDGRWTMQLTLVQLGFAGMGTQTLSIELERRYFTHAGKAYVLIHYRIPSFTYDHNGRAVVQWGEGIAVTDPGFGQMFWNAALHRAVRAEPGGSGRPYRFAKTMAMVDAKGKAVIDPRKIGAVAPLVDHFYGTSNNEIMGFIETAPGSGDQTPIGISSALDIMALSLGENSANQLGELTGAYLGSNRGNETPNPIPAGLTAAAAARGPQTIGAGTGSSALPHEAADVSQGRVVSPPPARPSSPASTAPQQAIVGGGRGGPATGGTGAGRSTSSQVPESVLLALDSLLNSRRSASGQFSPEVLGQLDQLLGANRSAISQFPQATLRKLDELLGVGQSASGQFPERLLQRLDDLLGATPTGAAQIPQAVLRTLDNLLNTQRSASGEFPPEVLRQLDQLLGANPSVISGFPAATLQKLDEMLGVGQSTGSQFPERVLQRLDELLGVTRAGGGGGPSGGGTGAGGGGGGTTPPQNPGEPTADQRLGTGVGMTSSGTTAASGAIAQAEANAIAQRLQAVAVRGQQISGEIAVASARVAELELKIAKTISAANPGAVAEANRLAALLPEYATAKRLVLDLNARLARYAEESAPLIQQIKGLSPSAAAQVAERFAQSPVGRTLNGVAIVMNIYNTGRAVNNLTMAMTGDLSQGTLPLTRSYGTVMSFVAVGFDLASMFGNAFSGNAPGMWSDIVAISTGQFSDFVVLAKGIHDTNRTEREATELGTNLARRQSQQYIEQEQRKRAAYEAEIATLDRQIAALDAAPSASDVSRQRLAELQSRRDAHQRAEAQRRQADMAEARRQNEIAYQASLRRPPTAAEWAQFDADIAAAIRPDYPTAPPRTPLSGGGAGPRAIPPAGPTNGNSADPGVDYPTAPARPQPVGGGSGTVAGGATALPVGSTVGATVGGQAGPPLGPIGSGSGTLAGSATSRDPIGGSAGRAAGGAVAHTIRGGPLTITPFNLQPVAFHGPTFIPPVWVPPVWVPPAFDPPDPTAIPWTNFDDDDWLHSDPNNLAYQYEDIEGRVETDLSKWAEWLSTQNVRELTRLALSAGYPNLASALADAQNIIRLSQDSGYRRWAMQQPSCGGYVGCGPSFLERWAMKSSIVALGDILNASRSIFSTAGLSDIGISGTSLAYILRDFGVQDGDTVNIKISQFGRTIFTNNNFVLTNAGNNFAINLRPGVASLEIYAVNEGSISPNTAEIKVNNVTRGQATQSYSLSTGETATLRIATDAPKGN